VAACACCKQCSFWAQRAAANHAPKTQHSSYSVASDFMSLRAASRLLGMTSCRLRAASRLLGMNRVRTMDYSASARLLVRLPRCRTVHFAAVDLLGSARRRSQRSLRLEHGAEAGGGGKEEEEEDAEEKKKKKEKKEKEQLLLVALARP
jgi:hypothetical protein